MSEARALAFRWILPVAQLLLCAAILLPIWPDEGREIHASLRAYGLAPRAVPPSEGGAGNAATFDLDITSPEWRQKLRQKEQRERIVVALNGLGSIPEVASAIVSPANTVWVPSGMFTWTWLDISCPILGMLFWFVAGRGIEALASARKGLARPRIRWWEVVLSLVILAYGGILAGALIVDPENAGALPWRLGVAIGVMWFVLGAAILWARAAQWRLKRRAAIRVA